MDLSRVFDENNVTKVVGMRITALPENGRQLFPYKTLFAGIMGGWLSINNGVFTIDGQGFQIESGPGHYCCHCGVLLDGQVHARVHVNAEHSGAVSPDPNNPSGYRVQNGFMTTFERSGE